MYIIVQVLFSSLVSRLKKTMKEKGKKIKIKSVKSCNFADMIFFINIFAQYSPVGCLCLGERPAIRCGCVVAQLKKEQPKNSHHNQRS